MYKEFYLAIHKEEAPPLDQKDIDEAAKNNKASPFKVGWGKMTTMLNGGAGVTKSKQQIGSALHNILTRRKTILT